MLLLLYRLLSILAVPLVYVYLWKRRLFGKEHATRWRERFGHATFPRPDGAVIWLHAASVG